MVTRLLAAYRERMKARPDSEHGQAMLRIAIVALCLVYTAWVTSHDPSSGHDSSSDSWLWTVNLIGAVFSVLLFARIVWNPRASPVRRAAGALHDNLAVTLWLYQAGPLGALYLFVYPFVTVGNGFRFGVKYLAWSGLLGVLGIGSLVASAPEWQSHQVMGLSVLLSHVVVTLYIGVLLGRLQHMQQQLQRMATYDLLTGLPNRLLFMERLSQLLASRQRGGLACLYLDLDGFKAVNDRHGHEVGDQLLKQVARTVAGCIRGSDTSARLGGDEFGVILDGLADPGDAQAMAHRIITAVSAIHDVDGHAVDIATSIGIAFLSARDSTAAVTAEVVVAQADEAMYRAKKTARGQYRFANVTRESRASRHTSSQPPRPEPAATA